MFVQEAVASSAKKQPKEKKGPKEKKEAPKEKTDKPKKEEKPKKEKEANKKVYQEKKSEAVSESQESLVAKVPEKKADNKLKFVESEKMGPAFQSEIEALQQLLMAKEKEIGRLQKHIDKQEVKQTQISTENS